MDTTWNHPRLGTFRYDGIDWTRDVPVPAFRAFEGFKKGQVALAFEAYDGKPPTPAAARLAERVIATQARLVPKVIEGVWNDFMGRGPDSGMYWHGNLEEVFSGMDEKQPLRNSIDLLDLMRPHTIRIRKVRKKDATPLAEISFHASFEEEHGVGVLTDGQKIVGIGYSTDCDLFKAPRRRPARRS